MPSRSALEVLKFFLSIKANKHSSKGEFGLIKEVENKIKKEIDERLLRLSETIEIAKLVVENNVLDNSIQQLLEEEIKRKLELGIETDVRQLVNLFASMKNYKPKKVDIIATLAEYIRNLSSVNKEKFDQFVSKSPQLIWVAANNVYFSDFVKTSEETLEFFKATLKLILSNLGNFSARELVFVLEGCRSLDILPLDAEQAIASAIDLNRLSNHDKVRLCQVKI